MRPSLTALLALVVLGLLSVSAWRSASTPGWNLDGSFYAVLMQSDSQPLEVRHRAAYASTAELAPADAQAALERGSDYRRALHDHVEVFALQLPFYTNKPLYLWCGKLARVCGAAVARAPYVVSALAWLAIAVGLTLLAIQSGARPLWVPIAAALSVLSPPLRELADLATPDALSTGLLVAGASVAVRSPVWATLPLMAASLARPDVGILALGILAACWTQDPTWPRARAISAAGLAVVATSLLVPVLTHSYGWEVLMRHTFVQRCVTPDDFQRAHVGWSDYLVAVGKGLHGHDVSRRARFEPFLALAAVSGVAYFKTQRSAQARAALHLLVAIWIATAVRFLVFPAFGDRHFAPAHVLSVALSCALLASLRRKNA
ncbi:MAG TPA: hypothetical protein VJV78_25210 [Polyangiales bacterium]|nr:hypothetical protein [Polyangiales bacterium]